MGSQYTALIGLAVFQLLCFFLTIIIYSLVFVPSIKKIDDANLSSTKSCKDRVNKWWNFFLVIFIVFVVVVVFGIVASVRMGHKESEIKRLEDASQRVTDEQAELFKRSQNINRLNEIEVRDKELIDVIRGFEKDRTDREAQVKEDSEALINYLQDLEVARTNVAVQAARDQEARVRARDEASHARTRAREAQEAQEALDQANSGWFGGMLS
jgi:hypothetical protein